MQTLYFQIGFDSAYAAFERAVAAHRYEATGQAEQRRDAVARAICSSYDRVTALKLIHGFIEGHDCFWRLLERYRMSHAGDTDWELELALDDYRHTLRTSALDMSAAAAQAYLETNREFRADYEAQLKQVEQLYAQFLH